jgi:hypothetical protein
MTSCTCVSPVGNRSSSNNHNENGGTPSSLEAAGQAGSACVFACFPIGVPPSAAIPASRNLLVFSCEAETSGNVTAEDERVRRVKSVDRSRPGVVRTELQRQTNHDDDGGRQRSQQQQQPPPRRRFEPANTSHHLGRVDVQDDGGAPVRVQADGWPHVLLARQEGPAPACCSCCSNSKSSTESSRRKRR